MHDSNGSMLALIVILSLGTLLWLSRAQWQRKRCPACRWYIPARATRCAWCHTRQGMVVGVLLFLSATASAAETGCPVVSFFAEPCLEEVTDESAPPPPTSAPHLFPKEAVAADTPPALLQMLQHPERRTLAQARRIVAETREKARVIEQVKQLVQQATTEQPVP